MWIFSCWDKSWPFQLQKLRFWIKSAFSGEFLVVEEEKTYCSDQEALCMEALHWNKRFEKQNASKIYFKRLPIAQLIDAVYKRLQRWYLSSAPENVRQLWSDLFIFSEGLNGWAMIRICKTVHWSHQLSQIVPLVNKVCLHGVNNFINQALETMLKTKVTSVYAIGMSRTQKLSQIRSTCGPKLNSRKSSLLKWWGVRCLWLIKVNIEPGLTGNVKAKSPVFSQMLVHDTANCFCHGLCGRSNLEVLKQPWEEQVALKRILTQNVFLVPAFIAGVLFDPAPLISQFLLQISQPTF